MGPSRIIRRNRRFDTSIIPDDMIEFEVPANAQNAVALHGTEVAAEEDEGNLVTYQRGRWGQATDRGRLSRDDLLGYIARC